MPDALPDALRTLYLGTRPAAWRLIPCLPHPSQNPWSQLAKQGRLMELDLTLMEGFSPIPEGGWNVAAHVLFEYHRKARIHICLPVPDVV